MPNDPRGSSSHAIRCDVIGELGELHHGRKRVQSASGEIREFYREAAKRLKHQLLMFDERDRREIAAAVEDIITNEHYTCWACAIMPDHVHLLIRKHKHTAEEMIAHFQHTSRLRLRARDRRNPNHPRGGGAGWNVLLAHPHEVRRTIGYIEENPMKIGLPRQRWEYICDYDGWPLHPGHSPRSPYARALRAAGRYP